MEKFSVTSINLGAFIMSRIGKKPISIPDKVAVTLDGLSVTVKGPKGELSRILPEGVSVAQSDGLIIVSADSDKRKSRERHGLSRTLIANMIEGVSNGYSKKLEIVGVGSRAQVKGKKLVVSAGYSHPVEVDPPDGITFKVESNTNVLVSGIDKELVGNEAAKIRGIRPPEPYKGKGIKYSGERIIRKAGKSGKK
ncbi:LSU ribosomal protein L6p (L9e) [Prochlorococcus sp. MIT 0602]|nr:LSU ribosomal protein L6p (L9e) [Prochlorococcus sp. MIT 0602]